MRAPKLIRILVHLTFLLLIMYIGKNTFYKIAEVDTSHAFVPEVIASKDTKSNELETEKFIDYKVIIERDIFATTAKVAPPPKPEVKNIEDLKPTKLSVSLLGTIVSDEKELTRAIIFDRKKRNQDLYRSDDTIQGALIKQILRNKVILNVNGMDEILFLVEPDEKPRSNRRTTRRSIRNRRSRSRRY